MTLNFPGPYEFRMFYTVLTRQHVQKLSMDVVAPPNVGDPFSTITAKCRDENVVALNTAADAWVVVMKAFLKSTEATITHAELWKYTTGTFDATYLASYNISVAGTSAGVANPSSQIIYTFRSDNGGIMRVVLMDTTVDPGPAQVFADLSAASLAVVNLVNSDASPWMARDNGYTHAFLRFLPGQSERWFKKLNR